MPQRPTKTQKFRKSQLALKNKIWSLARFVKLSFTSTVRNVTIWCALESPGLGKPFKYLERYHITSKKAFRATWSWKCLISCFLEPTETFEISEFWSVFEAFFNFKWLIKGCLRPGLSSAHPIVTLRTVEVKLSFTKRAKDQILFFRANWDFRKKQWLLFIFLKSLIFAKDFHCQNQTF